MRTLAAALVRLTGWLLARAGARPPASAGARVNAALRVPDAERAAEERAVRRITWPYPEPDTDDCIDCAPEGVVPIAPTEGD